MRALIIIGCILLVLFLLGQIRVGASVSYSESGLFVKVKVGPVRVQILPQKKDEQGKEKKVKQSKKAPAEEKELAEAKKKKRDTLALAVRFIPLLGDAAGRLKRKICIDYLLLRVIWGSSDPASAAMGFGAGNAALGILWPILEHNFKVKKHDLCVDVDFERDKPVFNADAQATLTIGQGLALVVILGIKALKIILGYRREQTEQKAVQQ